MRMMVQAMNKHATLGMGARFGALLEAFAFPRLNLQRRLTPRSLRVVIAAADFAQVACVGVAAHAAASGAELPSWKALCMGLLVAGIAAAGRGAMRGTVAPERSSTGIASARAALSTAGSVGAAGTMCWLQAPDLIPQVVLDWFAAWAAISSALSAGLRIAAARLKPVVCCARRIVMVAEVTRSRQGLFPAATLGLDTPRCAAEFVDAGKAAWLDRLQAMVAGGEVDVVALALAGPNAEERIAGACDRLADQPVRVCLAIDAAALGRTPRALERFGGLALVDLLADPHGGLDGVAKRAMDVVLSALALVLLSPVLAAAAIAVRLESPGPAIFRQKRFGLGGRHIEVLKFRTMRADACDASGEKRTLARDPRVTRIGRVLRRLSIDELPQLANVLRGNMSLVGPRPHPLHMRVGELYYFDAVERYRARHLVKPGITGWAQVNGSRGEVDSLEKARRRVELDLWYLENWSFWVDAWIIVRTVFGGFLTRGAD